MNGKSPAQKNGAPMLDKLVVTNRGALVAKYGVKGFARIGAALKRMGKADAKRGIRLQIALLDRPTHAGVPAVENPASARQNKRAIDALFKALQSPDYLMILGGPDIIPHQPLRNPFAGKKDEETIVPSDLPYACDGGYSLEAKKFLGPTRALGRLPDIPGSSEVNYLLGLIDRASTAKQLSGKTYFGLSAAVWRGATRQNLRTGLGAAKPDFYCSPKLGPVWRTAQIRRPMHLINCHGDTQYAGFLGEGAGQVTVAIQPSGLIGKVAKNTVVAAECCYGAELYAPNPQLPKGMALSYLEEGAVAFLGSSTIAYGGETASQVSDADVICAHFLAQIKAGATAGRALLAARQQLLRDAPSPTPFELKTMAQFMLLGDPSYRAFPEKKAIVQRVAEHRARRKSLAIIGNALQCSVTPVCKPVAPTVSLEQITAGVKLPKGGQMQVMQYETEAPTQSAPLTARGSGARAAKAIKSAGIQLFSRMPDNSGRVAISVQERSIGVRRQVSTDGSRKSAGATPAPVKRRVFVVARMVGERVVSRKVLSTH